MHSSAEVKKKPLSCASPSLTPYPARRTKKKSFQGDHAQFVTFCDRPEWSSGPTNPATRHPRKCSFSYIYLALSFKVQIEFNANLQPSHFCAGTSQSKLRKQLAPPAYVRDCACANMFETTIGFTVKTIAAFLRVDWVQSRRSRCAMLH